MRLFYQLAEECPSLQSVKIGSNVRTEMGIGHWEWGIGIGVWGMGHGALGIEHWALSIGH